MLLIFKAAQYECVIFEFDPPPLFFCWDLYQNTVVKDKYKSKKTRDSTKKNEKKKEADEGWTLFSDFHEITHIVIKESIVTIYRQDNRRMVPDLNTSCVLDRDYPVMPFSEMIWQ